MDTSIQQISAQEILDSRGVPTIKATVKLANGALGSFAVPSGASTGIYEALELRDNDLARYNGKGVLKAIQNIETEISQALIGKDAIDQEAIDKQLLELDGTKNKSKLGANSMLAVSFSVCRAAAISQERKLYNYLNSIFSKQLDQIEGVDQNLPIPMFNILNGGAHADNTLSIQEFMVIPQGVKTYSEQLRAGAEINRHLRKLLKERGATTSVGDEGGFAPSLPTDEIALEFLVEAVEASGYILETQIVFGLDIAASQYWEEDDKVYAIPNVLDEKVLVDKPDKIGDFYIDLMKKFPIYSIEDPLAEDDWKGWRAFSKKINFREKLLVGDDLTVTNPERVKQAIKSKVMNAMIIKPNQIGTLTEVFEVIQLCNKHKIVKVLSHRSGETTDTFIADLAVAVDAQFIKDGAPIRGERVAKYNRLLEIERDLTLPPVKD
jgi:enolase